MIFIGFRSESSQFSLHQRVAPARVSPDDILATGNFPFRKPQVYRKCALVKYSGMPDGHLIVVAKGA